ncbi:hypothetical protein GC089_17250 [Cellulomonas sp. JZ18]|uniref:hypothetical protein n=1 Tax=Cellulomonas sp. JZ18 TaxID=2654191 RepID=UPI0012D40231|nr:hypothetical protein [Cellulomonas sp. JZ18]QGQ20615.1 hypothetical protein GC089_17250 [Cellulomonas sp. JZ18]
MTTSRAHSPAAHPATGATPVAPARPAGPDDPEGTGTGTGRARVWGAVGLVVAVLAVVLVVRSGLGSTAGTAAAPAGAASPEVLDAGHTTFGTAFAYADGLEVEVGAPQPFTPSPLASGADPGRTTVLVEVTVTNGTERTYRASTLAVTASSGSTQAPQVADPQHAVELSGPAFAVPPGGEVSFRLGFAVDRPDDLRLTVIPAIYGYAPLVVADV